MLESSSDSRYTCLVSDLNGNVLVCVSLKEKPKTQVQVVYLGGDTRKLD